MVVQICNSASLLVCVCVHVYLALALHAHLMWGEVFAWQIMKCTKPKRRQPSHQRSLESFRFHKKLHKRNRAVWLILLGYFAISDSVRCVFCGQHCGGNTHYIDCCIRNSELAALLQLVHAKNKFIIILGGLLLLLLRMLLAPRWMKQNDQSSKERPKGVAYVLCSIFCSCFCFIFLFNFHSRLCCCNWFRQWSLVVAALILFFFSHLVFVLLVTVCVCVRLPATTYAKVKILSVSKMVLKLNWSW